MDEKLYKQMVFEENRKSKTAAYLLWLFTGWFGTHRFYAGETKTGAIQLLLTLTGVGFIVTFFWWLLDGFLVGDLINQRNLKTLAMINATGPSEPHQVDGQAQPPAGELDPKREAMLADLRQTGYRRERRDNFSKLYQ